MPASWPAWRQRSCGIGRDGRFKSGPCQCRADRILVKLSISLVGEALLLTCSTITAAEPADTVAIGDFESYVQGQYLAYASPWSTFFDKTLRRGVDFEDTIIIRPQSFPSGTIIETRWPTRKIVGAGVWGYYFLSFGNYDGGHPAVDVKPVQVRNIHHLTEYFAFSYSGSSQFNLLNELYLTREPGNATAKVIEIGLFLHAPIQSLRFAAKARSLGTFIDESNIVWKISRAENYVMLVPQKPDDILQGHMNVLGLLADLMEKHVITGDEWFNGIAFGTEPIEDAGRTTVTISHWGVSLD